MPRETSKSVPFMVRSGHFDKYLNGDGIDVGAGADPLHVPNGTVRPWDIHDGDGQDLETVKDGEYDFVYSSHFLEHAKDIQTALRNWRRVVRSGGFLYIVVPDYIYYEKCTWPSVYNADHKHSFSIDFPTRQVVGRDNHWTLEELRPLLGHIVEHGINVDGFNYNAGMRDQTLASAVSQIYIVSQNG